jgi:CBS domain containing-hemolysin-like protein
VPGLAVEDSPAYETVGGYVMSVLGRVPVQGDRLDIDGGALEVTRMDGRRVDRLRFSPARPAHIRTAEGAGA